MTNDILFEEREGEQGKIGFIILNRQKALNALNHSMFIAMQEHLQKWQAADTIKAVIIDAAPGRAFSAGGDIRTVYAMKKNNDPQLSGFFPDEYTVNKMIFHYPKPYISLLDGITMGGGAGVSLHGSHRIATKNLIFAMPETTIGFYPDVGASYFLSRLTDEVGLYLGLTGEKIAYNDCYALGLIDAVISPDSKEALITELLETALPSNSAVTDIIKRWIISVPKSMLLNYKAEIQSCFSKSSVEDIIYSLETYGNEWCRNTADILKKKSPTSLKVTLQELQLGKKLDFDDCMEMENKITQQMIKGQDFFEGIRSVIIDKDQSPNWKPATLSDVKKEDVSHYFS